MKVQLKANLMAFAALLTVSGVFASVQVSPAAAIVVDEKPAICHPVEGKGELGNGWNLISPDKASSHIDEEKYPEGEYWKHETKDGRHDMYAVNGTCPGEPIEVDVCDPATKPGGISIAQWAEGVNCVEFTVAEKCGELGVELINKTPLPYAVSWSEGSADFNYTTSLPATFTEDYNGGSVDVYYWLVGAEKDYVVDRGLYNYWEETAGMVTVDTDCEDPEVPTTPEDEEPTPVVQVLGDSDTRGGAGELPTSLPVTGANEQLAAIVTIVSTIATAAGVYTLRGRSADLSL